MWLIASFIVGVVASFAAGRYFQTLAAKQPLRSAAWDMALLSLNALPVLSLWAGGDPVGYAVWIVGNGAGSYLVIKCTK